MSKKTRDGVKISSILRALAGLADVRIREGTKHPWVARHVRFERPCPIAGSTDARRMIVPWVREISPYQDSQRIYQALRRGYWEGTR